MSAVLTPADASAEKYLDAKDCRNCYGCSWRHGLWLGLTRAMLRSRRQVWFALCRWSAAFSREWDVGGCKPVRIVKGGAYDGHPLLRRRTAQGRRSRPCWKLAAKCTCSVGAGHCSVPVVLGNRDGRRRSGRCEICRRGSTQSYSDRSPDCWPGRNISKPALSKRAAPEAHARPVTVWELVDRVPRSVGSPIIPTYPTLATTRTLCALQEGRAMTGRFSTGIAIYGLQFQLGMIRDELERHKPKPDAAMTPAERRLWGRARGAVKAAATHLENLVEALLPGRSQ